MKISYSIILVILLVLIVSLSCLSNSSENSNSPPMYDTLKPVVEVIIDEIVSLLLDFVKTNYNVDLTPVYNTVKQIVINYLDSLYTKGDNTQIDITCYVIQQLNDDIYKIKIDHPEIQWENLPTVKCKE